MGFAVLHYDKQTGSSPGLSQHIERGCYRDGEWVEWHPTNVDSSRTHLNRELIPGDLSRDERITKRIKDAGVKTPRKDQVRALTLIMSASCEDMQRIMQEGKFDDWCESSIKWARETHGDENVVSAVLHLDEKTPHLHVTVVPIVQGLSKDQIYREKKEKAAIEAGEEVKPKRKYKKKDPDVPRLCAADVMARTRLKEYQTTYAEAVGRYGLSRGIDGSASKHIDINDWYKSLVLECQELEREIESKKRELQKEDGRKKTMADKVIDAFGSKKEVKALRKENARKDKVISQKDDEIQELKKKTNALEVSLQAERKEKKIALSEKDMIIAEQDSYRAETEEIIAEYQKRNMLENKFETARKNLPAVLEDPILKTLDIDSKIRLAGGEVVSGKSFRLAGVDYSLKNGGDISLKWNEDSIRITGGRLQGAQRLVRAGWMIFREWVDKCIDYLADGVRIIRGNKRENESAERSIDIGHSKGFGL